LIFVTGGCFPRGGRGASRALSAPAGSPLSASPAGVSHLPLQSTVLQYQHYTLTEPTKKAFFELFFRENKGQAPRLKSDPFTLLAVLYGGWPFFG